MCLMLVATMSMIHNNTELEVRIRIWSTTDYKLNTIMEF